MSCIFHSRRLPPALLAGLLLAALPLDGCRPTKPEGPLVVLQDFEHDVTIKRWPRGGPGKAELATAWCADGTRSLALDPGVMVSFKDLRLDDWTGYDVLRFTVHNPSARTAALDLEIQDAHDGFNDRHQRSLGAPPGDHALELDFSGGLWRGEENRPYRGDIKAPIDITDVTRVAFTNKSGGRVFVDRLELIKVPPLATPGGFAFDFGPARKQVMGQTTGVFPFTWYTAARGHGFLGPVAAPPRALSYPTPLLGSGLSLGASFRVDLPSGPYLGWIAFERGGFVEGEQPGYLRADLVVNGVAVTGHAFSRSGPHFLFEDTELTDLTQIEGLLVRPAHAPARFRFDAVPGGNVFSLAVEGAVGTPLRVAGLILAPDTPEGAAFIDAHERRQSAAVAAAFPPQDRADRGRAPPSHALVVEPMVLGATLHPHDLPEHPEGAPLPERVAVAGQVAAAELALFAEREMSVHVEGRALVGPDGAELSAPRVSYGRYLPTRPLGSGPVWLEINHYRPEPDFEVSPELARAVLLEWAIPAGAAPGVYAGALELSSETARLTVPLRLRVYAVDLPAIPIPVGLFMSALPFGPDALGRERFWELQESLLEEQARAGLTTVTGGPGLSLLVRRRGGELEIAGDDALRYFDAARARGIAQAAVNYGDFFVRPPNADVVPEFARAFEEYALGHALPPFYFSTYDEPGTPAEMAAALAMVEPLTRAGLSTMGFLTRPRGDKAAERLVRATYATAVNVHTAADIRALAARGGHPWAYNNGMDRYAMGLHLYRNIAAGIEGRLEWIGAITQGFAFDNLDGREPCHAAWLFHDRLGILPTPRWLSAREGLLDLRVRLALERAVPADDPALGGWSMNGYGKDRDTWTDQAAEASRAAMLERLARKP